jgi:hypothetical protein
LGGGSVAQELETKGAASVKARTIARDNPVGFSVVNECILSILSSIS